MAEKSEKQRLMVHAEGQSEIQTGTMHIGGGGDAQTEIEIKLDNTYGRGSERDKTRTREERGGERNNTHGRREWEKDTK